MNLFIDPTPITSTELSEAEMAGISGGAVPAFVAAVIECGSAFGAVVIAVVDIIDDDAVPGSP
ncbi:MAG: hypothetical protein D6723_19775 [Acidobacteria bacterium]|nr:MAG: hypothetical protein D6723_19775 [Acidobacteriota bacterium]